MCKIGLQIAAIVSWFSIFFLAFSYLPCNCLFTGRLSCLLFVHVGLLFVLPVSICFFFVLFISLFVCLLAFVLVGLTIKLVLLYNTSL